MKKNHICIRAFLCLTFMLGILCITANAREVTLLDEDLMGVFETSHLADGSPGNSVNNKTEYVNGNEWASASNATGYARDTEKGLELAMPEGTAAGKEYSIVHKILAQPMPENTTIETEFEFTTGSMPTTSTTVFQYTLATAAAEVKLFQLIAAPMQDPAISFASTVSYPFTGKTLDRNSGVALKYDTSYRMLFRLTPNTDGTYRFAVELYSGSTKLAAGIINTWSYVTPKTLMEPNMLRLYQKANIGITKTEPIITIKHVFVKAIYDDVKPEATFSPKNGVDMVNPLGTFSVSFNTAVDPITTENVSISGDASVESVTMSSDQKKAEFVFSCLNPSETYTVNLCNIKPAMGDTYFDYEWQFKTSAAISFGNISVGTSKAVLEESMTGLDTAAVFSTSSEDVTEGNAWGSEYFDHWQYNGIYPEEDYLWIGSNLADAKCGNAKQKWCGITKKFDPVQQGETLELSFNLKYVNPSTSGHFGIHVDLTDDSFINDENNSASNTVYEGNLINVFSWVHNTTIGSNLTVGVGGTSAKNFDYKDKYADSESSTTPAGMDKELKLNMTLAPKVEDPNIYICKISLTDINGDPVYKSDGKTVFGKVSFEVSADVAANLTRIRIYGVFSTLDSSKTHALGIKDLLIAKKIGLSDGENEAHIDYTNSTPEITFDADVLVITEQTDGDAYTIDSVKILHFNDVTGTSGTLKIPFTISNGSDNKRFKFYVLNSVEKMVALADEYICEN